MITTDEQWQEIFEKEGCTENILKTAKSAMGSLRLSLTKNNTITENAVSDFERNLYRKLFALYKGVLCELVKDDMGEKAFTLETFFSEPGKISQALFSSVIRVRDRITGDPDLITVRFPVLKKKEKKITENFINAQIELLDRYEAESDRISDSIFNGKSCGRICGVLDMYAITRQHGRTVTGLVTEQGVIYYKPHDCTVDVFFKELADSIFSDITSAPRIVAGPSYGFCSQIVSSPVMSEEEIPRYFYRYGALVAVVNALCGLDIHRENVIACGGFPTLIDFENLMNPIEKTSGTRADTAEDIYLESSVLRLSNMPHRRYLESYLSSALHKCNGTVLHLPKWHGERYEVTGHEEEFIRGFSDGYDLAARRSAEISAGLLKYPEMELRFLYNSPGVHYYLLGRLVAAKNLVSEDFQEAELKRNELSLGQRGKDVHQNVLDYEGRFLTEGDAPYYFVKLNERALYGAEGELIHDLFLLSPSEMVKNKLKMLSEKDKETQIKLIRHSFKHALFDEKSPVPRTEITEAAAGQQVHEEQVVSEVKRIFEVLQSEKMYTPDGTVFFKSAIRDYLLQNRLGVTDLQADVTAFCFVVLMNPRLSDIHQEAGILIDECLNSIDNKLTLWEKAGVPAEIPIGMRFGYGGLLSAMLCGAKAGNKRCAEMLDRLILLLADKPTAVPALSGFMNGCTGLIFALCNAASGDTDAEGIRRGYVRKLADEVSGIVSESLSEDASKDMLKNKDPFLGLAAHGMALIYAGDTLSDSGYTAQGIRCYKKILDKYGENDFSAGVGLFAAIALDMSGDDQVIFNCLKRAMEYEMRQERLLRQDVIENGNAIRVLFLVKAGKYLPELKCEGRAMNIIAAMIGRKNFIGEFISSPDGMKNSYDASFLTGSLGIGAMLSYFNEYEG